jgi:hypothetical protein
MAPSWWWSVVAEHPRLFLSLAVLLVFSVGRVFSRAGKPAWAALVPIYNIIVLCELSGQPRWLAAAYFVPGLNVIATTLVNVKLSRRFNKSPLFGLGLTVFPMVFWPVLGFGSARYRLHA